MSIAVTVTQHWSDGKKIHVIGTLAATGDYVTGGDTVDFGLQAIKSTKPPVFVYIDPMVYTDADLNIALARFVYGSTIKNGKVYCFNNGGQVAAGAYPTPYATMKFYAIFHQFV